MTNGKLAVARAVLDPKLQREGRTPGDHQMANEIAKDAAQVIASLFKAEMTGMAGVGSGGTTTANLPFNKLIAPSTPKTRKDDESDDGSAQLELPDNVLAVVKRIVPVSEDESSGCPACVDDGNYDGVCPFCGYDPGPSKIGEELQIQRLNRMPDRVLRVPTTQQTLHFCAPAAAQAVLGYWGIHVTEAEVAEAMGSSHVKGSSVDGVVAGLKSFGLSVQVGSGGNQEAMKDLIDAGIPVLFFWFGHGRRGDGNHASVLVGYDDDFVWVMDPEVGMLTPKPWKKFLGSWFTFAGVPSKDSIGVGEFVVAVPG